MDNLMQNLPASPMIVVAIVAIGLLVIYFFFKQLLKLALLFLLVFLAVGGYFYIKDPEKMPQNMMEALEKAKTETGKAVEKGKAIAEVGREAYSQGKTIAEKGKKFVEGMDNLQIGKDRKTEESTEAGEDKKERK